VGALVKRGFTAASTLNLGSSIGYVAMVGDKAIMFRGANPTEIGNWFSNRNNSSHSSTHGKVHAGFWGSYETLHDQVVEVLR
jgi:hypothetical protein